MFKLYVTESMIAGEAIRYIANKNGITARQIGVKIGMSECNVSRFLSDGIGFNKNVDKVLTAIGSDENELKTIISAITKICWNNSLTVKLLISSEHKDILIRNKELQKVIIAEIENYL